MATGRLAYCTLADCTARLFSAGSQVNFASQSFTSTIPDDPQRDTILIDLLQTIARRWDKETGRSPEAFAPKYDVRLFSGTGSQLFEVDDFVAIQKFEINTTPSNLATPTWTDLTSELTSGLTQARPLRFYPKNELFRMSTFYQDPYLGGNIRLTAVFGEVQPDSGAPQPTAPWFGQDGAHVTALAPSGGGWWITPEDVRKANAEWVVYDYHAQRAAYGDTAGSGEQGSVTYRKGIPPSVQDVISSYKDTKYHVAMVTPDGDDIGMEGERIGTPGALSRWSSWQASQ